MASVPISLQGYLKKEKSKNGLLRGLTGDINKRYFRIQKIKETDELALCYYKNSNDPDVRGWVYLRDITEIAEDKDTMIFSSAARTLHLYAETRAEHNQWVTGMAALCPKAFIKLERNAPLLKRTNNAQLTPIHVRRESMERARHISEKQGHKENLGVSNVGGTGGSLRDSTHYSIEDVNDGEDETIEADHHILSAEDEDCRRSTSEDLRKQPSRIDQECDRGRREKQSSSRASIEIRDSGDSGNSMSRKNNSEHRGDASTRGGGDINPDEGEGAPQNESRRRSKTFQGEDREEMCGENYDFSKEISDDIQKRVDREVSATVNEGERREQTKNRERGEVNMVDNIEDGSGKAAYATNGRRRFDSHSSVDGGDDLDEKACVGKHSDNKYAHESGTLHDKLERKPEFRTLDGDESANNLDGNDDLGHKPSQEEDTRHATDRKEEGGPDHTCSNQDEERELDQCAELEILTPSLEITWEKPRRRGTATSRLHRHISRIGEPEDRPDGHLLPPPKEFLSNHSSGSQSTIRRGQDNPPEAKDSGLQLIIKSTRKSRRRSAADLEWGDGELPQEHLSSRLEEKLAVPVNHGPVDVSDSEDEAGGDLNLEIEKQRRRASAAVQALEAAAKEADKERGERTRPWGSRMEGEDSRCRSSNSGKNIVLRKGSKTGGVPAPARPPPGPSVKARRGHGAPPPGMAAPKLAPRSCSSSERRHDYDENCVSDSWDDEAKSEAGVRALPLPASGGGTSVSLLDANISNKANHWWYYGD